MSKRQTLFADIIAICLIVLVTFVILFFSFVKIFPYGSWINFVEGRSMEPTLIDEQCLFSDRFGKIERGDFVTARMPGTEETSIIKRVVGMPGDEICIQNNQVFLNGYLLDETYLTAEAKQCTSYDGIVYAEVELADDEYFLMGDNRGNSNDSRNFGPVEERDIRYEQSISITTSFLFDCGKLIVLFFVLLGNALGIWRLADKLFIKIFKFK